MKIKGGFMKKFSSAVIFIFMIVFLTTLAQAQQSENAVACDEASEPIQLNYGDHTTGCSISPTTDLDIFFFDATAGDRVWIRVDSTTNNLDPRAEVRCDDVFIDAGGCSADSVRTCSFNLQINITDNAICSILLSDSGTDNAGNYTLQLELIPPRRGMPEIINNSSESDSLSPTTDMDFFVYNGKAGTDIRILVDGLSNNLDPRIILIDPTGTIIRDELCNADSVRTCSFTVDETLAQDGIYFLAILDNGIDNAGGYRIGMQCLSLDCPLGVTQSVPVCDIHMSQPIYTLGDTVTADVFRIANQGPDDVSVELKVWLNIPTFPLLPLINAGADGSLVLPAGLDIDLGPLPLFPVDPALPAGAYEFNCRMLVPETGRQLTLDMNKFDVDIP